MTQYIDLPIVVDPDTLAAEAIAEFQARIPGWVPADGNPEVVNIEANARIASVIAALASAVPVEIVTFLGPLMGVTPIRATRAAVASTWTAVDNLGYTIPDGTTVNLRAADGSPVPFQTLGDTVIPPGSTVTATGGVTLIAVDAGLSGSGLGGAGETLTGGNLALVDVLAFVTEISLVDITTGGVDDEAITSYLNRFTTEMTLIAPRPILPPDAALLALDTAGVARVLVLDGYNPSGGTYSNPRMMTVVPVDVSGAAVGSLVKTALQASLEAKREVNFIVNVIDATYTEIDVAFTFSVYPGFDPAEVKPRAEAAVRAYLSPATWGNPIQSAQTAWVDKQYVRLLELGTVINNVQGLDEVTPGTLLFGVHGGAQGTTDIHLGQPAGLPTPGTIVGTAA